MEKCKYCQAELEEGVTLCPACGKDNAETAEETVNVEQIAPETEEVTAEVTNETAEETAAVEAPVEEPAEEKLSAEIQPGMKVTPGKIALAVAAVVVLLALLIALIVAGMNGSKDAAAETVPVPAETAAAAETAATEPAETIPATVPADGEAGTITEKGTYTVSDEDAKANAGLVVATVGGRELTNAQLQVYYWMEVQGFLNNYAAYAPYFGLDYTQPLDTQVSMESEDMTWQHYFLQSALYNWQQIQAMDIEAEKAGLEISAEDQEYLNSIPAVMEQNAANYSMELDAFLLRNIGPAAGIDEFVAYQSDYLHGVSYYDAEVEKFVPTEQDVEAYFTEHEADYAASGLTKDTMLVDVRHILLMPEGGTTAEDGTTTYSDEEWKACEDAAQAILDTWIAGEKTEESFAALANEHSADGGSNTNGGLYEDVYVGQMVQNFNDWCFDTSRKYGDTGLVKTEYGYHIMYFVESQPQWKQVAESDWVNTQINALFDSLTEKYPMEVSYDKIALGYVAMG